jgi:hypothetical protein
VEAGVEVEVVGHGQDQEVQVVSSVGVWCLEWWRAWAGCRGTENTPENSLHFGPDGPLEYSLK